MIKNKTGVAMENDVTPAPKSGFFDEIPHRR